MSTRAEMEARVMAALSDVPLRAGNAGVIAVNDPKPHRKPQHYALIGGKVLKSLTDRGAARWVDLRPRGSWGWVRT